jgi:nitroreductase
MEGRLVDYLKTRRTSPAAQIGEPGPDAETLRSMLAIAARVPDHGKLAPWRFLIFEGEQRQRAVDGLVRIAEWNPEEKERRVRAEKARFFADGAVIVGVISAPIADHPKIPVWEQQLSAGAVCLNLLHAAQAHGFAAQWLTGWFAYDSEARRWLGVKDGEQVAGFIHIGTPKMPPSERDRPDLDVITTYWRREAVG